MTKYRIEALASFEKANDDNCPKNLSWAWDLTRPIYKQVKSFTGHEYGMIEQFKMPEVGGSFTKIKITSH